MTDGVLSPGEVGALESEFGWTTRTMEIKKGNTRQRRSRKWRAWRRYWNGQQFKCKAWIGLAT